MSTAHLLLLTWRFDALAIVITVTGLGAGAQNRHCAGAQPIFLFAAIATVVVATASPLATLADGYLFSAHMLQHLLLLLVAPPLMLLGLAHREGSAGATQRLSSPVATWSLGVGAMWLWHAPTLCNAASQSAMVHRAQEVSLLLMGTAFWWPILTPRTSRRLPPLGGVVYLFSACVACTILGIIVTFSPVEICSAYLHPTDKLGVLPLVRREWGITPSKDQELGGLVMWVPACLVYAVGILGLLSRWYRSDAMASRRISGHGTVQ